jgi:hypothetical protein
MDEVNISDLRNTGRPLWVTPFGHDSLADSL